MKAKTWNRLSATGRRIQEARLILATRPNARIFRMHSKEKRTVKAVFRCFRTVSYAVGAE